MRKKSLILIALGVLGVIFVCSIDVIMGKPVNDITGPKSIVVLIISVISIVSGVRSFKKIPK